MTNPMNKLTKIKVLNIIAVLFIIVGLALLSTVIYFHFANSKAVAQTPISTSQAHKAQTAIEKAEQDNNLFTGLPVSISVPGVRPDLSRIAVGRSATPVRCLPQFPPSPTT
jgi:hypothetical protein